MTPNTAGSTVRHLRGPAPEAASIVVAADTDVRTLIPGGASITHPQSFAADIWETAGHPAWSTKAGAQTKIDFSRIPTQWRTAAKEWTLLQVDPARALDWAPHDPIARTWPETQEPVKLVTAQGNVKLLTAMLNVLDTHGIFEPTADDWSRVALLMRAPQSRQERRVGAQLAAGTLRGRAQQAMSFWSIRSIVGRPDLLGTEPFEGAPTSALFGSGHAPKRNLRRPHEDVGYCLGFVAWVIDHITDDVLAHSRWWAEQALPSSDWPDTRRDGYEAMTSMLHDLLAERGALPGTRNNAGQLTLASAALAPLVGAPDADEAFLWGRFAMRRFNTADLDEHGGNPCPLPITELPLADGTGVAKWATRLLGGRDDLRFWQSAIVHYAMFYIAATCGLRDKDLAGLPRDCIARETRTRPTGETYEVINMRGYKTKNRRAPEPTSWKVNSRIARTVEAVQQLHRILEVDAVRHPETGEPVLFDAQLNTQKHRSSRATLHIDLSYMDWLRNGARRLQARGVIRANLDEVANLTTTQIRITALQAYAARPLGNALAAQFGQWTGKAVAMGYTSDVYQIVHLASPTDALELQHEHIGRTVTRAADHMETLKGRGVVRLQAVIDRNASDLSNPGPLSPARLKALGRRNSNIEVGPYTICVFNPDGALCGGAGSADFRLCRPGECRNSAMTTAHRARMELRRRLEARTHPALHRSAAKIAAALPQIEDEFEALSDDDLVKVIAEDMDDYLTEALGLSE